MKLKPIYDISLESADGQPNFLDQFKSKATLIVNTTVGCGNANQMEILQWLQEKYGGDDFQIVAIPTNDYCGPGVTYGKWSEGITCGMDSQNYGQDVYGTTFKFSQMVSSNPNQEMSKILDVPDGHNGLGQPFGEPHELYKEISLQQQAAQHRLYEFGIDHAEMNKDKYYSWWLNLGFYNGVTMGGNFEKYLVDKDGYVDKHYPCTSLNWDIEATIKEEAKTKNPGQRMGIGMGRSKKVFEEEWAVVCQNIEELIAGRKSIINPENISNDPRNVLSLI